jgi:hypothetical protein
MNRTRSLLDHIPGVEEDRKKRSSGKPCILRLEAIQHLSA